MRGTAVTYRYKPHTFSPLADLRCTTHGGRFAQLAAGLGDMQRTTDAEHGSGRIQENAPHARVILFNPRLALDAN
jgi:hypothetical protein